MASALLMVACCMQAQTKSDSPPWILENSGIITKQYFITSKKQIPSVVTVQNLTYGSLRITTLVVNHDPVYKMRPMEYSKGDALTGLKLSNGENLPSLEQYLEAGKNCNTRLILELKAHSNKKRETKAVQGILAMVKKMGLENRMEYITFSCMP